MPTRRRAPTKLLVTLAVLGMLTIGCSSHATTAASGSSAGSGSSSTSGGSKATSVPGSTPASRDSSSGVSVDLNQTFDVGDWSYKITNANLRAGQDASYKVLDLSIDGVNHASKNSYPEGFSITIAIGDAQARCASNVKHTAPPSGSVSFVLSCSLTKIENPTLTSAVAVVKDRSNIEVARLPLSG